METETMETKTLLTGNIAEAPAEVPAFAFDVETFIGDKAASFIADAGKGRVVTLAVNRLAAAKEKLAMAEKRLKYEREQVVKLTRRKENLLAESTAGLSNDIRDFEKDQTAISKMSRSIDIAGDAISLLENDVIPKVRDEIRKAKVAVGDTLICYCETAIPIINSELKMLADKTSFLELKTEAIKVLYRRACHQIFGKFGVELFSSDKDRLRLQAKAYSETSELTENEKPKRETVKVTQINAKGKSYFCKTAQEQQIFAENNPDVKTESFHIELQAPVANKYLNDPENKKQFIKR